MSAITSWNDADRLQLSLTLYGHIKTAEQRPIIQQYGDWYTGRWWVGCYIYLTFFNLPRPAATAATAAATAATATA